jgi:phosphoglycolate phosphatase
MYHAVDDVLAELDELRLFHRLVLPRTSKTREDAKLVRYVRIFRRLHPKIKAEKKVSRTDLFEVLFGGDEAAKRIAHEEYNRFYSNYFGKVRPLQAGTREVLDELKRMGLLIGVPSNRNRDFLNHELKAIDGTGWIDLFDTISGGDEVTRRKPAPDVLLNALCNLNVVPGLDCWYVGDSTTDTIAAKTAGITSIYFNAAGWDQEWLRKVFPGSPEYPHKPDAVVRDFQELLNLVQRTHRAGSS